MPSLTINDLPAPLLTRLRQRVAADRCSLNRAVIYLGYVQDEVVVTTQSWLTFEVIQPLWRSRGPCAQSLAAGAGLVLPIDRS